MQWYFRIGQSKNISGKAAVPAIPPIIDGAPSVQTRKSSVNLIADFLTWLYFLKYVWPSGCSLQWLKGNNLLKDINIIITSSYTNA